MAVDALALFKQVYDQGIANGLTTAAAGVAAQEAMADVLRQQALQVRPSVVVSNVDAGRLDDPGPLHGGRLSPVERAARLSKRPK